MLGSNPAPRTKKCGGGQVGKAAALRWQRFCGFDPRPPYYAGMGKLVKPLGSGPRDFVGSTPTPRTKTMKRSNEKRNRLRLPRLDLEHGGVGNLVKPPVSNSGDFVGSIPTAPTKRRRVRG